MRSPARCITPLKNSLLVPLTIPAFRPLQAQRPRTPSANQNEQKTDNEAYKPQKTGHPSKTSTRSTNKTAPSPPKRSHTSSNETQTSSAPNASQTHPNPKNA